MIIDANAKRRSRLPGDLPMEALKADHRLVRQLFDRYFQALDVEQKKDLGPDILLLLEMHTSLEEGVFYARVREAAPALVAHCALEHEHVRQLIDRLKLMDEGDPQTEQMFHQLADAVITHIETEEQQLFPKIGQAGLDLPAIGQEMRIFETSIIANRHQPAATTGMRQ